MTDIIFFCDVITLKRDFRSVLIVKVKQQDVLCLLALTAGNFYISCSWSSGTYGLCLFLFGLLLNSLLTRLLDLKLFPLTFFLPSPYVYEVKYIPT